MAVGYYEEAINIRQKIFGLHPTLGHEYNKLSLVFERLHDLPNTKACTLKGFNMKRMLLTPTTNAMLAALLNMAHVTFMYHKDTMRALSFLDEAYGIREELGLNHHLTAAILNNRGIMQMHLEKYDQAVETFEEAVRILKREMGVRPRWMANALCKLGTALKHVGRLEEATQKLNESLRIIVKIVDDNGMSSEAGVILKDDLRELKDVKRMMEMRD